MVTRLREGRFVIPDFQRDFEWVPWDISALMRSLFRDCYIGSLLRLPRLNPALILPERHVQPRVQPGFDTPMRTRNRVMKMK